MLRHPPTEPAKRAWWERAGRNPPSIWKSRNSAYQYGKLKRPGHLGVQVAYRMKIWASSLAALSTYMIHDQEMVNLFAIELVRGRNEPPPYIPSWPVNITNDPGNRMSPPSLGKTNRGKNCSLPTQGRPARHRHFDYLLRGAFASSSRATLPANGAISSD